MNTLYYRDNLKILPDYIRDESVDLIRLNPPFNTNQEHSKNMPITFKENDQMFAECYAFLEEMQAADSKEKFEEAKKGLIDLAVKLRSTSGEYTPSDESGRTDRQSKMEYLQEVNRRIEEAKQLHMSAVKSNFGQDGEE